MDVTYTRAPRRRVVPDLLELRQSLGLTQREAALLLEVTVNTWARWERGELGVHPERTRQGERFKVEAGTSGARLKPGIVARSCPCGAHRCPSNSRSSS